MRRSKTILIVVLTGAAHWVLWLAYANNVGVREIVAGFLAADISVAAVVVFAFQAKARFAFRPRDVGQAFYLIWYAFQGTWEILQALARQLFTNNGADSFIAAAPYVVAGDDAASAGCRALAVTYTTITPNFVVLGIVKEQRLLLYHQIIRGKVLKMTRNLGARP
jgi:multisubunit Na+/H+ antiporter MnhE subunit